ncbi:MULTISPECIES: hypothetical protein [Uliginosibacterium]|uniref:Uncharacterized protein n=1 Tax=Uliginosibacterium aquaticum TaxID=2731212 RepID=A0ABX2IFB2_9RHOO|nr:MULTISPECIES: hypothetical protein [Uliginosibacterium]MDO6384862.1 hypothetical protein [Uliginosibacterium sp. 31-12]NSL55426.1 hypothetical protein [Uliginosibacterium aquaticum]PLK48545.1 hypothetical protein C0V76_10780 [Uliginosibacterium sp. TH139]
MYIVAIAWLFTASLIAISQASWIAGLLSFFFWGLLPLCLLLWLIGTPARLRRKRETQSRNETSPASGKGDHPENRSGGSS